MPPTKVCGCGCGAPVARRFKPGHDAKLKSLLLREARQGSESAKRRLDALGWGHLLNPVDQDGTPINSNPTRVEATFSKPRPITFLSED